MVYKCYIVPIGGLYATYHLLGEPETAIDRLLGQVRHSTWDIRCRVRNLLQVRGRGKDFEGNHVWNHHLGIQQWPSSLGLWNCCVFNLIISKLMLPEWWKNDPKIIQKSCNARWQVIYATRDIHTYPSSHPFTFHFVPTPHGRFLE